MLDDVVFPPDWDVRLDSCAVETGGLILYMHSTCPERECPRCGRRSARIHSRYVRQPTDVPIAGYRVRLHLRVRRFFCDNRDCAQKTFAEHVGALLAPKARRTVRQSTLLRDLAFALGGKPGARYAVKQGMRVSRDTLLRMIRTTPVPQYATPRILGVDDWSYRKGVTYGTILVDLERHCPIDVLVDRTADTFAHWLEAHPGVEIISRDRASAYADGARRGAPDAVQVADRFHVVKNLGDHLKNMFERKNACLLTPQPGTVSQEQTPNGPQPTEDTENPRADVTLLSQDQEMHEIPRVEAVATGAQPHGGMTEVTVETVAVDVSAESFQSRKHYLFAHVHTLAQAGLTQRRIARDLGISRQTVKKYVQATHVPRYSPRPARASKLDLYKPYLHARWHAGMYKSVTLFLEIKERGYTGSWALVGQYLCAYQRQHPRVRSAKAERGRPPGSRDASSYPKGAARSVTPQPMLSARDAVWVMLKKSDDLTEKQQHLLAHLRAFDAELEAAYQVTHTFLQMLRERQGQSLEMWLGTVAAHVAQAQIPELGSFAAGIRRDYAAVQAGLTVEISQGQVEGQVNRLKTLKRAMFGRAKLDLLRARVLHPTAA